MQEIDITLSTSSQSVDIGLSQTTQSMGIDVQTNGLAKVNHDETLQGDGTSTRPLGIADDVMAKIETFTFEQGIAADVWVIEHNLDKYPSVSVVDSANNIVSGNVHYIDENNLTITFNGAFTGKAFLN